MKTTCHKDTKSLIFALVFPSPLCYELTSVYNAKLLCALVPLWHNYINRTTSGFQTDRLLVPAKGGKAYQTQA